MSSTAAPGADPDPDRVYRRHVRLAQTGPGEVAGELADDAQHFRVTLRHDGARVRDVEGATLRVPWSTCHEASARLEVLRGMPLSPDCTAVGAVSPARIHCTHLFDLAGLAVAHAARAAAGAGGAVEYRCAVWGAPERTRATLDQDGVRRLDWTLEGLTIRAEAPFDGMSLTGSFLAWAREALPPALAECAIVLRRATYISPVRWFELDGFARASDVQPATGQCYTYTDGTAQRSVRQKGSRQDFTHRPEALLGLPHGSAPGDGAP